MTPGFVYAEAENMESIRSLCAEHKVAAILFECIQGEGGVIPLSKKFVKEMCDFAAQNDILTVVDEVQTGNGRSGSLYAYMNYGIQPDIVSTAKGLGGGLPIGATLFGEKTANTLGIGDHGSTFGGNPVCCAGALSILSRIDDNLLHEVQEKSNYIFTALQGAPGITDVSGMGLMIGIATKRPAKEIVSECMENGVLTLTAKDRVRLLPALNIPFDTLKQAIEVIKQVCAK